MQYIFSSIGTHLNDNYEGKNYDHFDLFLLSFSFLDPKVNNFDNTHGCPLRNQNDILDNPIPCKLTLSVYSIWSMKRRYDPRMFHNTNLSTSTMLSYLI